MRVSAGKSVKFCIINQSEWIPWESKKIRFKNIPIHDQKE